VSSVVEPTTAAPTPVHRRGEEGGHVVAFLTAVRDPDGPLGWRRDKKYWWRVAAARVLGR
jgi:hypothetical protein